MGCIPWARCTGAVPHKRPLIAEEQKYLQIPFFAALPPEKVPAILHRLHVSDGTKDAGPATDGAVVAATGAGEDVFVADGEGEAEGFDAFDAFVLVSDSAKDAGPAADGAVATATGEGEGV